MVAKPAVAKNSVVTNAQLASGPTWNASACMLAVDFLALSAIYWIVVIGRNLITPGYTLSFYLSLFPSVGLFMAAFLVQGLYPGVLLHPAEEIRRIFYCISSVFLLIGASTFLWRNADFYSRSVFLL